VCLGNATLYRADCREVLPLVQPAEALITDPVWPNVPPAGTWEEHGWPDLAGREDPFGLMTGMFASLQGLPQRAVVVMRNDSDPRFLLSVPSALPYFRAQILSYVLPSRIGRKLGGEELAYGFGSPPKPYRGGRTLMPGRSPIAQPTGHSGHPCGRSEKHMQFLVHWWSSPGDLVLDPFMGAGTTGVACALFGQPFTGIEIETRYFDVACKRIEEAQRQMRCA
jgi:site-specific DNA-methyltransferase (adenine-specific)